MRNLLLLLLDLATMQDVERAYDVHYISCSVNHAGVLTVDCNMLNERPLTSLYAFTFTDKKLKKAPIAYLYKRQI